jgi:hypothetical protein
MTLACLDGSTIRRATPIADHFLTRVDRFEIVVHAAAARWLCFVGQAGHALGAAQPERRVDRE